MPSISSDFVKDRTVTEVPAGSTAVLNCHSNDYNHNFLLWLYDGINVIGPGNNFDNYKYKYDVLSGKLHINSVMPNEAGLYTCLSKKIDGTTISAGEVEMIVSGSTFNAIDVIKVIASIVSIIVIIGCAVLYRRLRKEWSKYDGHTVVPVDEVEDEEGDGDEVYNQTTTSINQPVPGPSRNHSSEQLLYGIDNHGLDTDFNSVFENIQIKTPEKSLI